jgi:two-component system nitrate/nitrite response regulator NarL
MCSVKVVVADPHPVVVYGLTSLLGAHDDFNVVAGCCDGTQCMQAIRDLSPDIALLDMFMPGLPGLDILASVTSEQLPTRVVFLTAFAEDRDLLTAVARGAYGVIFKDATPSALLQSLRRVVDGRRFFPLTNGNGNGNGNATNGNVLMVLTEREREIMHLVAEGLANKEVGRLLNISDGTIKVHLHHIYRKLAITNRTALAALEFTHHGD